MNNAPLVSVLVPNYNHERYLPLRIESILNQTFSDFELILMDDCSTDGSVVVLEHYAAKDKRITVVANKQNSGSTFLQWKKGIGFAKGKYIWIAESDDFAELSFLAELVPLLENNSSLALAYSNSTIVDADNKAGGTTADWKNNNFQTDHWSHDFSVSGQEELEKYLSTTCTINNASSVVFRRASIEAAGGVDVNFRFTGDWLMYQKLSLVGDIAYLAKCLSNYREHTANASKNSLADGSQLLERQKCFAYLYHRKVLSEASQQRMLDTASREFQALSYNLLRRSWQPGRLIKYMAQLAKINKSFYMHVQVNAFKFILRKQY